MRHYPRPYLPVRPPFLLASQLPYDDLLKSPEGFAEWLYYIPRKTCQTLARRWATSLIAVAD
jgi:hypothetical protein